MRVIKNNNTNNVKEIEENKPKPLIVYCSECSSELEITKNDTHIGWLGERYITCPCCGKESIVNGIKGITLTVDNLQFPKHFLRTNKDLRKVVEIKNEQLMKEIKKGIAYFRKNKDEYYWYTTTGDLFLVIFRYAGDKEYSIVITRDWYNANISFSRED